MARNLSHDGHWLAYMASDSTGQAQVYVEPFPPTGAKYQVTTVGGGNPVWSRDGRQLFYLSARSQIMSVEVQTQTNFVIGKTTPLPMEGIIQTGVRSYDISPDGKYFVVMLPSREKAAPPQINITLNWFEELKQ